MNSEETKDFIRANGVGLKESEWKDIEDISCELGFGWTRNAVSAYALRWFTKAYKLGFIKAKEGKIVILPSLDE